MVGGALVGVAPALLALPLLGVAPALLAGTLVGVALALPALLAVAPSPSPTPLAGALVGVTPPLPPPLLRAAPLALVAMPTLAAGAGVAGVAGLGTAVVGRGAESTWRDETPTAAKPPPVTLPSTGL